MLEHKIKNKKVTDEDADALIANMNTKPKAEFKTPKE